MRGTACIAKPLAVSQCYLPHTTRPLPTRLLRTAYRVPLPPGVFTGG
jgi:hypothetical protein